MTTKSSCHPPVVIDAHKPLYPQIDWSIPMWSTGCKTVQSHEKPGPGWFKVFVGDRSAK